MKAAQTREGNLLRACSARQPATIWQRFRCRQRRGEALHTHTHTHTRTHTQREAPSVPQVEAVVMGKLEVWDTLPDQAGEQIWLSPIGTELDTGQNPGNPVVIKSQPFGAE